MQQRTTGLLGFRRRWRVACLLAASLMLAGPSAHATVQVLPEMTLKREGRTITGAKAIRADQTMQDILTAFDRAEHALERQDLSALMQFYASGYNYHGLHVADVERIWGEVFEHYRALSSTHLFSEMKVVQTEELALSIAWWQPNRSAQQLVGRRDTTLLPADVGVSDGIKLALKALNR